MGPFVFQRKPQLASVTNEMIARYPRSQGGFLPALSGTKETWLAPDDPLATVLPTPHDRWGGARRRCPAPICVQHSPPGRRSTCDEMLRFSAFSKVCRAMFSSQVN